MKKILVLALATSMSVVRQAIAHAAEKEIEIRQAEIRKLNEVVFDESFHMQSFEENPSLPYYGINRKGKGEKARARSNRRGRGWA